MKSKELKKYKLPDRPGVYFFKQNRDILYIGKATSLKDRVRSYFNGDIGEMRGPKISQMLELADNLDWQETDSVLEALLLETELIKKHQPKYNSREKDDKSYWFVVITKEDFPKVELVRGRVLFDSNSLYNQKNKIGRTFGPFPYASEIKGALKIIRKIFTYRDKCKPCIGKNCHPCFNRQINLCPGVCSGEISETDYRKIISHLILFFTGQKKQLIKNLEKEMKESVKKQDFEQASMIRDQIFTLKHIQDVSLLKRLTLKDENPEIRIEAYDIAHLSGQGTVGSLTVWQDGSIAKDEYKHFKLKGDQANRSNDTANLAEILQRRFKHDEWRTPDVIVVDGGQAQINIAKKVLAENKQKIEIVSVVKDDKHQAREILGNLKLKTKYKEAILEVNSEAHRFALAYHRKIFRRMVK